MSAPAGERTALVLPVPEAEHLAGRWRRRRTRDGARGMPPHLTLLHPFVAPERIDAELVGRLGAACAELEPFAYRLERLERFADEGILYLAPEPAAPLVAAIARLGERFPEHPLYGGEVEGIVPHVTVAKSDEASLLDRVTASVAPRLPLECRALDAWLMVDEPEGWAVRRRFALGAPTRARSRPSPGRCRR